MRMCLPRANNCTEVGVTLLLVCVPPPQASFGLVSLALGGCRQVAPPCASHGGEKRPVLERDPPSGSWGAQPAALGGWEHTVGSCHLGGIGGSPLGLQQHPGIKAGRVSSPGVGASHDGNGDAAVENTWLRSGVPAACLFRPAWVLGSPGKAKRGPGVSPPASLLGGAGFWWDLPAWQHCPHRLSPGTP